MITSISSPNQQLNPGGADILGVFFAGAYLGVRYAGSEHPMGSNEIHVLYNESGRECFRITMFEPKPPVESFWERVWEFFKESKQWQ